MSRVTTWHSAASQCLRCMKGRNPPPEYGSFSLTTETVHLPLDVPLVQEIQGFFDRWHDITSRSRLSANRKSFCKEFSKNVIRAYDLVGRKPQDVSVQELYQPLGRLEKALTSLMHQKDHDDEFPVQWEETEGLPGAGEMDPADVWTSLKLDYTKQCLFLVVHILAIALPDHAEEWDEWCSSLHVQEWPSLFVLDSLKSQMASTPRHPRRRDVVQSSYA